MLLAEDISSVFADQNSNLNQSDHDARALLKQTTSEDWVNRILLMKFQNSRLVSDLENLKAELKIKENLAKVELEKLKNNMSHNFYKNPSSKFSSYKKLKSEKEKLIKDQEKLIKDLEAQVIKLREQNRLMTDSQEIVYGRIEELQGRQRAEKLKLQRQGFCVANNQQKLINYSPSSDLPVIIENHHNQHQITLLHQKISDYKNLALTHETNLRETERKYRNILNDNKNLRDSFEESKGNWSFERRKLVRRLQIEKKARLSEARKVSRIGKIAGFGVGGSGDLFDIGEDEVF